MSTWTSRPAAAALWAVAPVALAGCLPGGIGPAPAGGTGAPPAEPAILAGAVTAAAPEGWCPDPRANLADRTAAFALFGPCRGDAAPPVPAILTLSVLGTAPADAMDPERLDGFFRSEVGRAAISRSGDPALVRVVQTAASDDAFLLQVQDLSEPAGTSVAPGAWRAVLPLNGRLVALTVLSPAEPALPPATLRSVLDAFLARMRAANAAPAAAAPG